MNEVKIMLGNEAIARGAFEAGVKVSAAYPGTPSTEISENIVKYPEIYAEWSPNEKVAMEVAIGASISGVRAMHKNPKTVVQYEKIRYPDNFNGGCFRIAYSLRVVFSEGLQPHI